jgi:hypothetical protein
MFFEDGSCYVVIVVRTISLPLSLLESPGSLNLFNCIFLILLSLVSLGSGLLSTGTGSGGFGDDLIYGLVTSIVVGLTPGGSLAALVRLKSDLICGNIV